MAVSIGCFIADLFIDPAWGQDMCTLCQKHGIREAVEFAEIRLAQLNLIYQGASAGTLGIDAKVCSAAKAVSRGRAYRSVLRAENAVKSQSVLGSPTGRSVSALFVLETDSEVPSVREPSRRRIDSAVAPVIKGLVLGIEIDVPAVLSDILTIDRTRDSQMAAAIRCAEVAFATYASGSKRALSFLDRTCPEEWAIHRRTCTGS